MSEPTRPIPALEDRAEHQAAHGEAVRAMFDRIAPTYDVVNKAMSAGRDAAWRRATVRELHGIPSGPVLDLCAGTMDLTALLARRFPSERVVALDLSEAMLRRGHAKAPRAEILVGDALALPFDDRTIAGVVCGFGMRNVADLPRAVREVRRVLVPGGRFVTLDAFRPDGGVTRFLHAATTRVFPTLGGLVSGDRAAYAYFVRSIGGFVTRDDYEKALATAGFVRVRGQDRMFGAASIVAGEVAP